CGGPGRTPKDARDLGKRSVYDKAKKIAAEIKYCPNIALELLRITSKENGTKEQQMLVKMIVDNFDNPENFIARFNTPQSIPISAEESINIIMDNEISKRVY